MSVINELIKVRMLWATGPKSLLSNYVYFLFTYAILLEAVHMPELHHNMCKQLSLIKAFAILLRNHWLL